MSARAVSVLAVLALVGCTAPPPGPLTPRARAAERADRARTAGRRALDWLATTDAEMGVDVLMAMQIYAALAHEPRALDVAAARHDAPGPSELERFGRLLELDKTPLDPGRLDEVAPSATTPNPADELTDDRVVECLDRVLSCEVTRECVDYVELDDRWGYVLTHQAVTLLVAHWIGCPLDVDVEERRRTFAANLVAETRADPRPSELYYERLAMLGHLGFASAIEPAWIDALLDAQTEEGCFPVRAGQPCHPHPTGVALWALAHAIE